MKFEIWYSKPVKTGSNVGSTRPDLDDLISANAWIIHLDCCAQSNNSQKISCRARIGGDGRSLLAVPGQPGPMNYDVERIQRCSTPNGWNEYQASAVEGH